MILGDKMLKLLGFLICFFYALKGSTLPHSLFEEWRDYSNPQIISSDYVYDIDDLPLEGSIEDGKRAWSGHYWPSREGGINNRWNTEAQEGFSYKSPQKNLVLKMPLEELKKLSPSENLISYWDDTTIH